MKKIRLLIADDYVYIRAGIEGLVKTEPDIVVVGLAANGIEAVSLADEVHPDVILMDLKMPGKSGIEAIQEIVKQNQVVKIIALTSYVGDDMVFPAIKAGAAGYLLKDCSVGELINAIRRVHAGEIILHSTIARKLMGELQKPPNLPSTNEPLTPREFEILKLIARGLSNSEIADQLVISQRTVEGHVQNILKKLQLANRTQAALYAAQSGLE